MAEPSPPAVHSTRLASQLELARNVITESFMRWKPEELALSFNGGKDCTVLLHMLAGLGRLSGVRVVFFDTEHGFPEVGAFIAEMEGKYGFTCEVLGGFRPGLARLVEEGIKGVFLGTRRTDPHGGTLCYAIAYVIGCHGAVLACSYNVAVRAHDAWLAAPHPCESHPGLVLCRCLGILAHIPIAVLYPV